MLKTSLTRSAARSSNHGPPSTGDPLTHNITTHLEPLVQPLIPMSRTAPYPPPPEEEKPRIVAESTIVLDMSRKELVDCTSLQHTILPEQVDKSTTNGTRTSRKNPYPWQIVILDHNLLTNFDTLYQFRNLRKLDLSHNRILKLPDSHFWSAFPNLQVLYLHHNRIDNIAELSYLEVLNNLVIVSLYGNPVEAHPAYRHTLANLLPRLALLDFHILADSELLIHGNFPLSLRPLSELHECVLPKPTVTAAEDHLQLLQFELEHTRTLRARLSPIIRLQAWWRGVRVRKSISILRRAAVAIQRGWRRWRERREARMLSDGFDVHTVVYGVNETANPEFRNPRLKIPDVRLHVDRNGNYCRFYKPNVNPYRKFDQIRQEMSMVKQHALSDGGTGANTSMGAGDTTQRQKQQERAAIFDPNMAYLFHAQEDGDTMSPSVDPMPLSSNNNDNSSLHNDHIPRTMPSLAPNSTIARILTSSSAPRRPGVTSSISLSYNPYNHANNNDKQTNHHDKQSSLPSFTLSRALAPPAPTLEDIRSRSLYVVASSPHSLLSLALIIRHTQLQHGVAAPPLALTGLTLLSVPTVHDDFPLIRADRSAHAHLLPETSPSLLPGAHCPPQALRALRRVRTRGMSIPHADRLRREVALALDTAYKQQAAAHDTVFQGALVFPAPNPAPSSVPSICTYTRTSGKYAVSAKNSEIPIPEYHFSGSVVEGRFIWDKDPEEPLGFRDYLHPGENLPNFRARLARAARAARRHRPQLLLLVCPSKPFLRDVVRAVHSHNDSIYEDSSARNKHASTITGPRSSPHATRTATHTLPSPTKGSRMAFPWLAPSSTAATAPIYMYPHVTVRVMSAVLVIQAAWRSYRARKHRLHPTGALVAVRRAQVCISRWWKTRLFRQRMHMLRGLARYGALLQDNVLFMRGDVYHLLKHTPNAYVSKCLFPEHRVLLDIAVRMSARTITVASNPDDEDAGTGNGNTAVTAMTSTSTSASASASVAKGAPAGVVAVPEKSTGVLTRKVARAHVAVYSQPAVDYTRVPLTLVPSKALLAYAQSHISTQLHTQALVRRGAKAERQDRVGTQRSSDVEQGVSVGKARGARERTGTRGAALHADGYVHEDEDDAGAGDGDGVGDSVRIGEDGNIIYSNEHRRNRSRTAHAHALSQQSYSRDNGRNTRTPNTENYSHPRNSEDTTFMTSASSSRPPISTSAPSSIPPPPPPLNPYRLMSKISPYAYEAQHQPSPPQWTSHIPNGSARPLFAPAWLLRACGVDRIWLEQGPRGDEDWGFPPTSSDSTASDDEDDDEEEEEVEEEEGVREKGNRGKRNKSNSTEERVARRLARRQGRACARQEEREELRSHVRSCVSRLHAHGWGALSRKEARMLKPWHYTAKERLLNLLSVGVGVELVPDVGAALDRNAAEQAAIPSVSNPAATAAGNHPASGNDRGTVTSHASHDTSHEYNEHNDGDVSSQNTSEHTKPRKWSHLHEYWVKLTFPSVTEARIRALALAVSTWDPLLRQSVVLLMTAQQVAQVQALRALSGRASSQLYGQQPGAMGSDSNGGGMGSGTTTFSSPASSTLNGVWVGGMEERLTLLHAIWHQRGVLEGEMVHIGPPTDPAGARIANGGGFIGKTVLGEGNLPDVNVSRNLASTLKSFENTAGGNGGRGGGGGGNMGISSEHGWRTHAAVAKQWLLAPHDDLNAVHGTGNHTAATVKRSQTGREGDAGTGASMGTGSESEFEVTGIRTGGIPDYLRGYASTWGSAVASNLTPEEIRLLAQQHVLQNKHEWAQGQRLIGALLLAQRDAASQDSAMALRERNMELREQHAARMQQWQVRKALVSSVRRQEIEQERVALATTRAAMQARDMAETLRRKEESLRVRELVGVERQMMLRDMRRAAAKQQEEDARRKEDEREKEERLAALRRMERQEERRRREEANRDQAATRAFFAGQQVLVRQLQKGLLARTKEEAVEEKIHHAARVRQVLHRSREQLEEKEALRRIHVQQTALAHTEAVKVALQARQEHERERIRLLRARREHEKAVRQSALWGSDAVATMPLPQTYALTAGETGNGTHTEHHYGNIDTVTSSATKTAPRMSVASIGDGHPYSSTLPTLPEGFIHRNTSATRASTSTPAKVSLPPVPGARSQLAPLPLNTTPTMDHFPPDDTFEGLSDAKVLAAAAAVCALSNAAAAKMKRLQTRKTEDGY